MAAIYVNGIKTSCMAIEGGGGMILPTKFWQGNQSEYDALSAYTDDTLYLIQQIYAQRNTYDVNFTQKIYIGDKQVFPQKVEGYDYFIENLTFPDSISSPKIAADLGILTDIDMELTETYQRDWQLEFNCEYSQTASIGGDQVVFGCQSTNKSISEVYFNTSGKLCLCGGGISDTSYLDDAIGHDIKLIYRNGTGLEIYKDNVYQRTLSSYSQRENTQPCRYCKSIGQWGTNRSYYFHGTIHYLKFKWLD